MSCTLYRFTSAEGLVYLLDAMASAPAHGATTTTSLPNKLKIDSVHGSLDLNGAPSSTPSAYAAQSLLDFDHLVCDFDETITDHDTTSSFDTLAQQIRPDQFLDPQMTWSEILQAYLDDLNKVDVSDLCHLNHQSNDNAGSTDATTATTATTTASSHQQEQHHGPVPLKKTCHHLLDPRTSKNLTCHVDGRVLTPEPELPALKLPSLQPWMYSQVRKRAVEKVSLDRVFESGNLVGLTRAQIRQYGRDHIKLRPGMKEFLSLFVQEQDRKEQAGSEVQKKGSDAKKDSTNNNGSNNNNSSNSSNSSSSNDHGAQEIVDSHGRRKKRGELWIVSVNWSSDLIRGVMDQIFGSEEATERYLPEANLISSNLQFLHEDHHELQRRRKSSVNGPDGSNNTDVTADNGDKIVQEHASSSAPQEDMDTVPLPHDAGHLSNGMVKVHCLTGTDKLHAFQKVQRDYAVKHGLSPLDTKWAYLGDSSTDLGCLVEADVGIVIGKSSSLLTECERCGIQVIDIVHEP
ncbi:hypothetical protein EDD11_004410 [Mortierella claussenii]|nr:hypothetical protein EDD11_004410 [Mortierella claussenii]